MDDPILIKVSQEVVIRATECAEEIREILPWGEDHARWTTIAPLSGSDCWPTGESWLWASEKRRAQVKRASSDARGAFRRHKNAFAMSISCPIAAVRVGYESLPFGAGRSAITPRSLAEDIFPLAVKAALDPEYIMLGKEQRTIQQELLLRLVEFAGAIDFAIYGVKK